MGGSRFGWDVGLPQTLRRILAVAGVVTGLVFVGTGGGAGGGTPHSIPGAGQDAVAFQMTPAHTGVSNDPVGPQWSEAWSVTATGSYTYALAADGLIFTSINAASPSLVAYNAATGAVEWQVSVGIGDVGIAYDGGRLFEQSDDVMSAYDAQTGALDWSATLPGQYLFDSSPTATSGIVYTEGSGSTDSAGTLYALNETTGALLWTQPVENGMSSSPTVGGGNVYESYACDLTQAFNATSGTALWTYQNGCEGGGGQTSVLADGDLFLRDQILNATTGQTVRSFTSGPPPAVDANNAYTENGGTLQAQTVGNGSFLWSFAGDGELDTAPIEVNGVVYEGSSLGTLFGVSAMTGTELFSADIGTPIVPAGGPSDDDSIFGLTEGDGYLVVPAGDTLTVFNDPGTAPAQPVATATPGNAQATVAWVVPADNGSAITDFTITPYLAGVAQTPYVMAAGASSSALSPTPGADDAAVIPNLVNGGSYTFVVTADSAAGDGTAGATDAVMPESVTPSPPATPVATAGLQSAVVQWVAGASGQTPVTGFTITPYIGTTAQTPISLPASAVGGPQDPTPGAHDTYTVTGLTDGTSYTFTVVATNSGGTGAPSPRSNVVTPFAAPTAPTAPSDVSGVGGAGTATVNWNVPTNDGSTITSFTITPIAVSGTGTPAAPPVTLNAGAAGSPTSPAPGATDSYRLSGLGGGQYTFEVSATNAVGTGPDSAPSAIVMVNSPPLPALSASPTNLTFPGTTLGDITGPDNVQLTNTGSLTDTITGINFGGADPNDLLAFVVDDEGNPCDTIAVGASCTLEVGFAPGAIGPRSASMTILVNGRNGPTITASGIGTEGYYITTATGRVDAFGDALLYGDASGSALNRPITGLAATGDDGGYWLTASDGGIFSYGDASFLGSTGDLRLNKPIVGMEPTPDGGGYWLVASDGGIFSFGDAQFYGSTGALRLNKPIVGMAVTPDGGGYWLVASDGGIFSFGDAQFYGSTGDIQLNKPIVGMAVTPDGGGYWLVASDGGIFSFGDAQFYGSTGAVHLNQPIVGMAVTPDGGGYWLVASDGGVFAFGDAPYLGGDGGKGMTNVVAIAGDGPPTLQAESDVPADRSRDLASFKADAEHVHGSGSGGARTWVLPRP